MTIAAVVTAAGYGTRLGSQEPKALALVADRPLLAWALERIAPLIDHVVVTAPLTHVNEVRDVALAAMESFPLAHLQVIPGGETRQASVAAGIDALFNGSFDFPHVVLIHDAARAFMPTETMRAAIAAISDHVHGAVPVVPVIDTLVTAPTADGLLGEPVDRTGLRAVQTPQVFAASAIRDAHQRAGDDGFTAATDDATLARHYGYTVVAVPGHEAGFKVTHPADLAKAEVLATQASAGQAS